MTRRRRWAVALALVAAGCGGNGTRSSEASDASLHECGETSCEKGELCVATQGAYCQRLPPPGGTCKPGCLLTPHCCNCTARACLPVPAASCPNGPACDCLDGWLKGCPPDRRTCAESGGRVDLLCIAVAYDEDPFADAGSDAAGVP